MADRVMELALKVADRGARSLLDGESLPFFVAAPNDPYELGMYWLRSDRWGSDRRKAAGDAVRADCRDCYEYLLLRKRLRVHAERPELFILVDDDEDGAADTSRFVPTYYTAQEAVAFIRTSRSDPSALVGVAEDSGLTFYAQDEDGAAQGEPLARVAPEVTA